MSGTQAMPALTRYRAEVAWLMEQGESFGGVEDGIERIPGLWALRRGRVAGARP